jgi:Flp pilus assembly protein TadG
LTAPQRKRNKEGGQAILLVVVAMSIFLFGAVGLAIDGSHLYAQRQMAQAAADAAAQAGILSIFNGSNATGAHAFTTSSGFTCATSDARTPCYYAQTMNGFDGTGDTVSVDFPSAASVGVPTSTLSSTDPVNLLRVTIQRSVPTTLIGLLGASASTIGASGTAAIVTVAAPIPIIVTHPSLSSSFSANGTGTVPKIQICGGPSRSIQVNSSNAASLGASGNPIVDLSHAGPLDPGDCSAGTGADFGDFGGPGSGSVPFVLQSGTTGRYIQPASPVQDPLATVSAPSAPAAAAAPQAVAQGTGICPSTATKGCTVFSPGSYTTKIEAKNTLALFKPGIYYMNGVDFSSAANGDMAMATGVAADTATGWSAGNMLVYMTGTGTPPTIGSINVGANGTVNLTGSPAGSAYKGILFFTDRSAAAQTHTLRPVAAPVKAPEAVEAEPVKDWTQGWRDLPA